MWRVQGLVGRGERNVRREEEEEEEGVCFRAVSEMNSDRVFSPELAQTPGGAAVAVARCVLVGSCLLSLTRLFLGIFVSLKIPKPPNDRPVKLLHTGSCTAVSNKHS